MSSGLLALLDDIVALAKVAAVSLDDVAAQAAKTGTKAAGIVIDDTAVTPRYAIGFAAERELPIVGRIAAGSLRNKLLFLLPGALLLSAFAPWAITPLLMAGGLYLCVEGYEKAHEWWSGHVPEAPKLAAVSVDARALEDEKVAGAIRTDFILSAEIMAIALSTVTGASLWMQAAVLLVVAIMITVLVYGAVALIVKADDAGLALAQSPRSLAQRLGRALVYGMPKLLTGLSVIGTLAMLWVGGGIIVHGLAGYGLASVEHALQVAGALVAALLPVVGGLLGWLVGAAGSGLIGLALGALTMAVWQRVAPDKP
jgi:hypothetical protein